MSHQDRHLDGNQGPFEDRAELLRRVIYLMTAATGRLLPNPTIQTWQEVVAISALMSVAFGSDGSLTSMADRGLLPRSVAIAMRAVTEPTDSVTALHLNVLRCLTSVGSSVLLHATTMRQRVSFPAWRT